MSLRDRFRFAIAGVGRTLGGRQRPGVELVRLDEPLGLAPPPAQPLRALPAPTDPICSACGYRHPRPPRRRSSLAAYGRQIAGDPWDTTRPRPLGQGPAHSQAIYRDTVSPWRVGGPAPPPPSGLLDELREELHAPRTYWWDQ